MGTYKTFCSLHFPNFSPNGFCSCLLFPMFIHSSRLRYLVPFFPPFTISIRRVHNFHSPVPNFPDPFFYIPIPEFDVYFTRSRIPPIPVCRSRSPHSHRPTPNQYTQYYFHPRQQIILPSRYNRSHLTSSPTISPFIMDNNFIYNAFVDSHQQTTRHKTAGQPDSVAKEITPQTHYATII